MKKIRTILIAIIILCSGLSIGAQSLPAGTTNRGTDFWFSFPVSASQPSTSNALKIYVSCQAAVKCTVEVPGYGIRYVKLTSPNQIIEFSLAPGQGQPYEKDPSAAGARTEDEVYADGKGKGIHVTAPVPITVYGVSRFANTSDSFLALPTSALGKEYIVASYADPTAFMDDQHLMSQTIIVAPYDNTVVSFKLGGKLGTETVGGMKIGQTKSWKLNKGDIIAFANKKIATVYGDLSGSKITATKPVAVISGNQCASVDITTPACDYIAEMELPTMTWGKEYHVTPVASRKKYSFVKIFAKQPNTKLYRDGNPTPFYTIQTAGGAQGTGYYEGRIFDDGSTPRPIVIRGDKPISITQYNSGQLDDNIPSDPFQMVLTPVEQYQKEITFHTPGQKFGTGFKTNHVNVVFEANSDGLIPDDLEFGTADYTGDFIWEKLRDKFGFASQAFKRFPTDTKYYFQKTILLPENGTYKIRALTQLAAYAYGFDSFDSYGHPVSMALKNLEVNDPDTPIPTYSQECNGNVLDGKVKDIPNTQTDTTGRSNLSLITLLESSSNYRLEQLGFVAGDDQNANWKLFVEDATKNATASVYFSDRVGNDTTVTISYIPPAIAFDTTILDFGRLKVGEIKTMELVVRNTSTTQSHTITEINIGTSTGFVFTPSPVLPLTIPPGGKHSFIIQFSSASELVRYTDSVHLQINDCISIGVELVVGVGEPLIDVSDADFGINMIDTENFKTIQLRNTGSLPMIISGYTGPSLAEFTTTGWPEMTEETPLILQGGQELNLIVVFQSSEEGVFEDKILFKSDSKKEGIDSIAYLNARAAKTVGIEEDQSSAFIISPNPATGFATITLPAFKSQNIVLKVFDALGNEVADFSNNLLKTELRFDTKTLPNGAYFLRFTDGKTTLSRRFVIQN